MPRTHEFLEAWYTRVKPWFEKYMPTIAGRIERQARGEAGGRTSPKEPWIAFDVPEEDARMGKEWYSPEEKQGRPPGVGPPEEPGPPVDPGPPIDPPGGPPIEPPGGPPENGPPGQGPGGEGPPPWVDPGDGPPIPEGNVPPFPNPAQWPSVYGVPWDENWWQEDYEIDVVVGAGQPPRDHTEARHVGNAQHVSIHERAAAMYLSIDEYWELLAKAHGALEAEFENERGWSHPQQRFLRPKSEVPSASYAGCLECQGATGCARVHDILTKSRGKTNLVHRQIHGMGDEEITKLMDDLHRYMTCVRSDIWAHERKEGIEKGRETITKPYDTLASLPDAVKKLPKHGQEIYRAAFNAAYEEYGESRAHAIAWTAVKTKYEQRDGEWVAKAAAWVGFREVDISQEFVEFIPILKVDAEQRMVTGIVLEPGDPNHTDSQGDYVKAEEIEPAAHDFMRRYREQQALLGEQHEKEADVDIVESFIAPEDYQIEFRGKKRPVKKGSWVISVKVLSDRLWQMVKDGELTGFSIGGSGERIAAT